MALLPVASGAAAGDMVTTSDRLLSVLGLFTIERSQWTVEDAAKELGLAVSTAYRYFRSLNRAGLIVPFTPGHYVFGPAIIEYDRQMRLLDPLIATSAPVMRSFISSAPSDSLLLLCRLYRDHVMCVHQEAAGLPAYAVSYERGRPLTLYRGAASKVILANLPMRTVRTLHAKHAAEWARYGLGADWKNVKLRLREIRIAGICITRSELDMGLMGVSAPLFNPDGAVVGSLSIVLSAKNATSRVVDAACETMRRASEEIRGLLAILATGYQPLAGPTHHRRGQSKLKETRRVPMPEVSTRRRKPLARTLKA